MEITINIIPDYKKEEIAQANRLKLVFKLGMGLISVAVVFTTFLWGLNKSLDLNMNTIDLNQGSGNNKVQYDKIRQFDSEFSSINADVNGVIAVKNDQLYWSKLLVLLSSKLTEGVEITNLANKDYVVSIAGKASSRDYLISFKDQLGSESCFSDINLPLSNLVEKENVAFEMDFKVKEECLKNK